MMKRIILTAVFAVLLLALAIGAAAADITVDTVTFREYFDEYGMKDETLLEVEVTFTAAETAEEVTVVLASEGIPELSAATLPKVVYMNQVTTPADGTLTFPIERAKIVSATGLSKYDGCTLYVKMGGSGIASMATLAVTFQDPAVVVTYGDVTGEGDVDIGDAVQILLYEAGLRTFTEQQLLAADVTGEGDVDIGDAVRILRYEAGLTDTLR